VGANVGPAVGSHTVALTRTKPLRHSHVYEFVPDGRAGAQNADAVSQPCVPSVQRCCVGARVGAATGAAVGCCVGNALGCGVGAPDGDTVGANVGALIGAAVGDGVG
jgi:outer membrane lipoprotein SlyB